jgi:predicted metal-binding membrane protein
MGLLFVGGVMSFLWIAAIAFFVLAEKALPWGRAGGRLAAIPLIGCGLLYLGSALGSA